MKPVVARVARLEQAQVRRWWELCETLQSAVVSQLTDDELQDVETTMEIGAIPSWWTEHFLRVMASPAYADLWAECCEIEHMLLNSGYTHVEDASGTIIFPGMARQ